VAGEKTDRGGQAFGPEPAIKPDCRNRVGLERGQHRADVRAGKGPAVLVERHLRDDRNPAIGRLERVERRGQRGLDLQEILPGLDYQAIDFTGEQPVDLGPEVGAQRGERGVAHARQFRTGTD